jgi:hypothetical protein
MMPPIFQLKLAGEDADENNGESSQPKQLKSPGFSLDSSPVQKKEDGGSSGGGDILSKMGSAMGADFSNVNITTNSSKATDMGALAYAQGNDVHFAPGQYNPGSQKGQELIGHELAHVKQQREGRVQANTSTNGQPVNNDKSLEKEADDMGRMAASGKSTGGSPVQQKSAKGGENTAQAKVVQKANNPVTQPIAYILGEMLTNVGSSDVAYIRSEARKAQDRQWIPGAPLYHIYNAMERWYQLVRTGGPWDHKRHLSTTYGVWTDDTATSTSFNYDIWSNIHYGFIGKACGFTEWVLLAGAGAAQVMAGTVPGGYWARRFATFGDADVFAAFDDPKDQAAIRVGFSLYSSFGSSLTSADILSAVRGAAGSLQTQPMSSGTGAGGGGSTNP